MSAQGDWGVLYGFDAAAGKVLWTKPLPKRPLTSLSDIRRWKYAFTKSPDGFIWGTVGQVLVRIDPTDAHVHVVGTLPESAQIAFSGGRVYLAGGTKLRRLADLTVTASDR